MTDWNAVTLASLVARYPTGTWDVVPGVNAPEGMPVCMSYPALSLALAALATGGFGPTRFAVPAPDLDGPYDLTTCLRLSAGGGRDVVLVRRVQS